MGQQLPKLTFNFDSNCCNKKKLKDDQKENTRVAKNLVQPISRSRIHRYRKTEKSQWKIKERNKKVIE